MATGSACARGKAAVKCRFTTYCVFFYADYDFTWVTLHRWQVSAQSIRFQADIVVVYIAIFIRLNIIGAKPSGNFKLLVGHFGSEADIAPLVFIIRLSLPCT
jgi:hypothetical protein